jgi:hypothetical protein
MALYPEAILLGSSQMREAFTIPLATASFYGLLRYQQERSWTALVWMVAPVALYLPFSPPFAALMIGMLGLSLLVLAVMHHRTIFRQRWMWVVLIMITLIILAGLWMALRQFTPEGMINPLAMVSWWLRKSAFLQAYHSENASGLIQYIFDRMPTWMHLPLLVAYGVAQPFLPAALVAPSLSPIWPWITTLRAIGWTMMLILLIYAPILALSKEIRNSIQKQAFTLTLILIVWIGILVASYRGGGDLWDNPRYRSIFAGLQSALVAWTWVMHRRHSTPWLRRILFGVAAFTFWLLPWYFRRYTAFTWPIEDILITLGLGLSTACLLIFLDWIRERSDRKPPESTRHT